MKFSLQTIHLLPNTPWVIENDNNAARAFCIAAHRHMFLLAWHNCHSSSIFYLGNINLCCWSVRTVGGTEQSQASHIRALWSAGAKHKMQLRMRDHTTGSAKKALSSSLHCVSPHRFSVKLWLQHQSPRKADSNKLILVVSSMSNITSITSKAGQQKHRPCDSEYEGTSELMMMCTYYKHICVLWCQTWKES